MNVLRVLVIFLALLGVVAWYAPASAFNYARLTGSGGRSVSAAMATNQAAFVAASKNSCTFSPNSALSQTCQIRFYNNATAAQTIGLSKQLNNLPGTPTFTVDSVSLTTGTTTSPSKAKNEYAFFNITYGNTVGLSCNPCFANWQINGTAASNALVTHQDHWNVSITI